MAPESFSWYKPGPALLVTEFHADMATASYYIAELLESSISVFRMHPNGQERNVALHKDAFRHHASQISIRLKPRHGPDRASPIPNKQEITGSPITYTDTLIDAPIETEVLY